MRGGSWMYVLLALLIATPIVYALKQTQVIKLGDRSSAYNFTASDAKKTLTYNPNSNRNEKIISESNHLSSNSHFELKSDKKRREVNHKKTKVKTETANSNYIALGSKIKKSKKEIGRAHV